MILVGAWDMSNTSTTGSNLEAVIASFRSRVTAEGLLLPYWSDKDWEELFRFTTIRHVTPGDALVRHGEPDQTLYFVLRGQLEVGVRLGDGATIGEVAVVAAGSTLGEMAFFDGGPRSASAWAIDECAIAAMTPNQRSAFEKASPILAHELIFALGRILAIRLRRTNARLLG